MKTNRLLALGVLIGTCTIAPAQEAPPTLQETTPAAQETPPPTRPKRQMPPGLLEKFDTDGDGKISPPEMAAMQKNLRAKRAETIKKFDTDGDGQLTGDERKALLEDMEAKRAALVEKYDANENGKLDPEEVKVAREAGEDVPIIGRGPGRPSVKPPVNPDSPAPAPAPEADAE